MTETLTERLMHAIEGECDGLAITSKQADGILAHVLADLWPHIVSATAQSIIADLIERNPFLGPLMVEAKAAQVDQIAALRAALKPFAAMAPSFREYRRPGDHWPLQEATPAGVPIIIRSFPDIGSDPATFNYVRLMREDFERAEKLLK